MKKIILFCLLIFTVVISDAANRTGAIRPGSTMLSKAMTFGASDTITTSATVTITIDNIQQYLQHQTFTIAMVTLSGSPSVAITAYGKVTSGGSWVQIGDPITWTTTANNGSITSATPLNYNYLKVAFVASGATQLTKITAFEVKTANVWTATSTGAITTGAITASGLITANNGVTLGASDNLVGSSTSSILMNTNKFTVDGSNGNTLVAGTLAVTGATTATGAIAMNGGYTTPSPSAVVWAKGGSVVLATAGTDTPCANGNRFWDGIDVPYNVTITGIAYLVGSVGATDSVVVQLCNSAGVQVATSRAVGGAAALVGTAAQFQSVAFTTPYAAVAGKYFAVVQFNGTTAKFRTYPIPGSKFIANTAAGTWGTKADITPGTSFVADKGPILMTY